MLRQHRVDIERAADVVGRIDGADLDVGLVACCEHRTQIVGADGMHFGARDRVTGHTAAEVAHLARSVAAALAEKVDVGDDFAAVVGAKGADVGDQPVDPDDHLHLGADLAGHGDRRVLARLQGEQALGVQADLRAGAGNLDHLADRRELFRQRARRGRGRAVVGKTMHFVEELTQVWLIVHMLTHPIFRKRERRVSEKRLRMA